MGSCCSVKGTSRTSDRHVIICRAEQRASPESLAILEKAEHADAAILDSPKHRSKRGVQAPWDQACAKEAGGAEGLPHLLPKKDVAILPAQEQEWQSMRGDELEEPLLNGAWALIDAHWLIAHAAKPGARFLPRQQLPPEAFMTLPELKTIGFPRKAIALIVLSYPWLTAEHPDPVGHSLRLLSKVLASYVDQPSCGTSAHPSAKWNCGEQRWAVFIDFLSLHQHQPQKRRSPSEDRLFKLGLSAVNRLYAHQYTRVFRLTKIPPEFPSARPYDGRGWCFAETAWAHLTKSGRKCIDLGKYSGSKVHWLDIVAECISDLGRPPPLLPDDFNRALEERRFTNGKTDMELVKDMYVVEFDRRFREAFGLIYHNLGWEDAQLQALLKVLPICEELETLNLNGNRFADLDPLVQQLRHGTMPSLKTLELVGSVDQSNSAGVEGLQEVCARRGIQLLL